MDNKNSYSSESKQYLRSQFIKKKREFFELNNGKKIDFDKQIRSNILGLREYQKADVLLAYMANDIEVNVDDIIINNLVDQGKRVAVPKCRFGNLMDFYFIDSFDDLSLGKFGIREPVESKNKFDIFEKSTVKSNVSRGKDLVVMLLPGVVFDKNGYRIGYGRGYYDRYLDKLLGSNFVNIVKIGLCYDFALIDKIKIECNDVPVDVLITETKVYRI